MTSQSSVETLPLLYETPPAWATNALMDPHALLSDHAYLERKAASNALELLNRWPEPGRPANWTIALSGVARDEAQHLHSVLQLLQGRGGELERLHRSTYAHELRRLVRMGDGPREILDRLLVSALIEARSCERFHLLAQAAVDKELAGFYRGLWASEKGHFGLFLTLADSFISVEERTARWDALLQAEAAIIQAEPPGPRIHSGYRGSN
jgi:tRNA 2-(methylsulfanyl)-N6-isopentenyladenosine37 hydroxylase